MQPNRSSKISSNGGFSPATVLLCFGLPVLLLLLAFVGQQFINLDFIGWTTGFTHPLTGWDHLITMLAVGIWAAQLRGHAIWMLPLAFVGVMSLGGLAGAAGLTIPSVEGLILLSCAVFSILIIRRARFSTQVNVMIVAFFAFFHGFAHGQEISTSASLISYTLGFMLATLLLHGAGIIVAKLVVLSVTCLVAIFFSSITQANTTEPDVTNNSKNITFVKDLGFTQISPFLMLMDKFDYGEACHSITEHYLCTEDIPKNSLDVGSDSMAAPPDKNFHSTTVKSSANKISENSKVAGNIHSLASKQATILAQENLQPVHQLYYSDYLYGSNLDFKRHYPDINHTPGKDLLSNGVGLTSPPQLFVNLVVPQNPQFFHTPPVLPFEDHTLQIAVAKLSSGNSSIRKTSNSPSTDYAIRNLRNVLEIPVRSKYCKNNPSFYLPPTNLFFHQNGLAFRAISNLDLLSVHKMIIKIRSNGTDSIFTST
jgi:urease accessory protein